MTILCTSTLQSSLGVFNSSSAYGLIYSLAEADTGLKT